MVDTVLTCPLGHQCEAVREGRIERCAWLVELRGQNPNTGEERNEHGCAMHWLPVLLVETSGAARSTSAAVESFRNEMVRANERTADLLEQSTIPIRLK